MQPIKTVAEYMAEGRSPEILFWVGCAGSFDERAQKMTKAFDGKDKDGKTLQRGSYMLEIKLRDFTKQFHMVRTVIEIL